MLFQAGLGYHHQREAMSKKEKDPKRERRKERWDGVSRRDFLKGMGTSAVAATRSAAPVPLLPGLKRLAAGVKEAVISSRSMKVVG
jgi:hypothetical protein